MTVGEEMLLLVALATLFAGAPLAALDRRLGYAISFVGSVLLVAAAIAALTLGPFTALSWTGVIGEPEGLRLDALSAFFALVAGIVWAATSVYSIGYDTHSGPSLAVAYSVTIAAIALLFCATDWLLFLAAWEVMTLAAYWIILEATGRPVRIFSAAFVFLAFGEASTLLTTVAIAALYLGTGSFAMVPLLTVGLLPSVVFGVALVGFGLKMGVAPFHMTEWLPIAHSSAPSNASAVLSSTLTLAGVYGLFRVLMLMPAGPSWWGAVLLVIGAISALLGAIFASVSEHTKGLPAYRYDREQWAHPRRPGDRAHRPIGRLDDPRDVRPLRGVLPGFRARRHQGDPLPVRRRRRARGADVRSVPDPGGRDGGRSPRDRCGAHRGAEPRCGPSARRLRQRMDRSWNPSSSRSGSRSLPSSSSGSSPGPSSRWRPVSSWSR